MTKKTVVKIPKKLQQDPIVEALFEIRFQSNIPSVSTLLPGLLYPTIKNDFEAPEKLPSSNFLPLAIQANPELKYQPSFRIQNKEFVILISDFSLIVSNPRPYVGWVKFKEIIMKLLKALEATGLVSVIERFSVKYLNLLTAESEKKQFELLRLTARLGNYDLTNHRAAIQSEVADGDLINLIEIRSNVQLTYTGDKAGTPGDRTETGMLVSVDTICLKHENFWKNCSKFVDKVHNKEKEIFYSLLTDKAVEECKPVW